MFERETFLLVPLPSNLREVFRNSVLFSPFPHFLLCGLYHLLLLVSSFMINTVATVFMVYLAMDSVLVLCDHIVNFTCRMNVNKFIFSMARMLDQGEYCLSLIWILFEKTVI